MIEGTWYRGIRITPYSAPIPNGPKWAWAHPDFDGATDSRDMRAGLGRTLHQCMADIDEMLDGEE